MITRQKGLKKDWNTVSARISPELKEILIQKIPNNGNISKLIQALLQKYADGKIIGVRMEI